MPARRTILLTLLVVVAVAACQPGASATPSPSAVEPVGPTATATATPAPTVDPDAIVVTVSVTGGECPNGPCGAEYVVYADGRVDGPDGGPTAITSEQVAGIASLAAATDWDAVRDVPFTGECPVNYDGQKHVYGFPADSGELVFDSCEFDLSSVPVIQAIDAAVFGG